ncbi:hypothetical protein JKV81_34495 [Streptomyces sp. For3]|uniref:hypothetical protein n=1 Tax=Streptomyces silvae TaxID=2803812 RepID=UPI00192052D8|nr:hypothetical protein [Streptomyces silvae]MBL1291939.1 hypothetical protein [Streptomyces silvae]
MALILAALLAACTGLLALAHRAAVRHGRTAPADASAPARTAGRLAPPAADPQAAHAD